MTTSPSEYSGNVLGSYESGEYAKAASTYDDDHFKAVEFLKLYDRVRQQVPLNVRSYIDVGCLHGGVAAEIGQGLRERGNPTHVVKGYDVSPQVAELTREGVEFVRGDFTKADENVDLVTLFDVFEHVLQPMKFVESIASRSRFVGLHIPLDDSLINGLTNRYRSRLAFPGHLIYLNPATALTFAAYSGLRVLDYEFTHGYTAESGGNTRSQRLLRPVRAGIAKRSPWLASRLVGGLSLMVICATEKGLAETPELANLGLDVEGYLGH